MSETLLPCPFCGAAGRLVTGSANCNIGCCGNDCPADPFVAAATAEEVIAQWNTRATPPLAPCEPSAEPTPALDFVMDRIGLSFTLFGDTRFTDKTIADARAELAGLRALCLRAREAPSVCDHAQTNLVKDSGHGVTRPFSFYLCMACGKQLTERENAARALFVKEKLT